MIEMTFEEYEKLEEEMEAEEIKRSFKYPSVEDAGKMLYNLKGLKTVLLAYYNTTDKEYRAELLRLLREEVHLYDADDIPSVNDEKSRVPRAKMSMAKTKEILAKLQLIDFQTLDFYPTKDEIDTYLRENTEENLAFMFWLLQSPIEGLTPTEEKTKLYLQRLINQRTKLEE